MNGKFFEGNKDADRELKELREWLKNKLNEHSFQHFLLYVIGMAILIKLYGWLQ